MSTPRRYTRSGCVRVGILLSLEEARQESAQPAQEAVAGIWRLPEEADRARAVFDSVESSSDCRCTERRGPDQRRT